MWVVWDTDTGWSEEDWRFASRSEAIDKVIELNAAAFYDHYDLREED